MKVFLSWSGTTSREVAEALADWLPKVVQGVEPFVSAKDIDKGANWTAELARELEQTQFGIICLAPDNLLSPWLNYETGAITKSVSSRVCPVLFGVEKEDVKPSMAQLQLTSNTQEEFVLLIGSLNKAAGSPLSPPAVREAVDVWWPRLQAELAKIKMPKTPASGAKVAAAEPAQPVPEVTEMFEELLARMRSLDSRVRNLEPRTGAAARAPRTASAEMKGRLRAATEHLTDAVARVGITDFNVRIGNDSIHVRIAEDTPIPETVADAAAMVASIEDVEVRVSTASAQETWNGNSSPVRADGQ